MAFGFKQMNKIYITGCAKTGTTLIRRLFNAFDLKVYNAGEVHLQKFVTHKCHSDHVVGKRAFASVFSSDMPKDEIEKQLDLIKKHGVRIVHVTRNKKDVLKSKTGSIDGERHVSEERYNAVVEMAKKYSDHITIEIAYEDVLADPDKVQKRLERKLGIKSIYKWSDFPDWFDPSEEPTGDNWDHPGYSVRKIGESYQDPKA
jgi:hypothetical protein